LENRARKLSPARQVEVGAKVLQGITKSVMCVCACLIKDMLELAKKKEHMYGTKNEKHMQQLTLALSNLIKSLLQLVF